MWIYPSHSSQGDQTALLSVSGGRHKSDITVCDRVWKQLNPATFTWEGGLTAALVCPACVFLPHMSLFSPDSNTASLDSTDFRPHTCVEFGSLIMQRYVTI